MKHTEEKQPPDVITSDTDNHTQIHPEDAPPGQQKKYRKFRAYNTGMWNGAKRENKEQVRRQDDLHLFDALSSQLELSAFQKERGREFIEREGIGDFTAPNRSAQEVIFALCAVVANDDARDGTRFWPNSTNNDGDFQQIRKTINTDWRALISLMMRLDHRVQ